MSKLSVGIVGLPNVGKSTLFNALLRKQQAYAANFPFATIEPNIGVVPVPDTRLDALAEVVKEADKLEKLPPIVPATVEFVDIAGLIAGAHKGEGLGNKFLSHIRQTDAICHVVRAFEGEEVIRHESVRIDPGSKSGMTRPVEDLSIIEMELALADLQTVQNSIAKAKRGEEKLIAILKKLENALNEGKPARSLEFTDEEMKEVKQLSLLTSKPILIALNVAESDLGNAEGLERKYSEEFGVEYDQVIAISAKVEEELSSLSIEEAQEYLKELGVTQSGLERLIKKAFSTLGLITFLTAGEKEVRAWTLPADNTAVSASGVIHTDFMKKFIKADVVTFENYVEFGGEKKARELGKVRQEGRDYIVKDGDVIEFKIGA